MYFHRVEIYNWNIMVDKNKLKFTGERFTPECEREIWYEHYHRYAFAKRLVKNKKVLDIACGEGYGSYILSHYAQSVVAVDIDPLTIEHAKNKYEIKNLTFIEGSCLSIPLEDASIDVVISFETLEHLAEQSEMLKEFNRVLKTDGLLVISTPEKKHYSDETGFDNEFHVKELYKHEFQQLLDKHWANQNWYSQAMAFHSILEKLEDNKKSCSFDILDKLDFVEDKKLLKPMYYIVIAAKEKKLLPQLPDIHLFADKVQSIYGHYNAVIRAHISCEKKYEDLKKKYNKIISIPVLGKIIKLLRYIHN